MREISTVAFLSESAYDRRVMKSIFGIVGRRDNTDWQMDDHERQGVDVVLVDCDTVAVPPVTIKNSRQARVVVAYAASNASSAGFDACLHKPVRSRDLVSLLDHLEHLLVHAPQGNHA